MGKLVTPSIKGKFSVTEVVFSIIMATAGGLTWIGFFGTHMVEVFVMLDITNHSLHRVLVKPKATATEPE